MLDLRQYASLGGALRDALERWPNETCLIEADRERENCRLTYPLSFKALSGQDKQFSKRYKLFIDTKLRQVVFKRFVTQFQETGACAPSPTITLCLAAGRVVGDEDRRNLIEYFEKRGWLFWDDNWLRKALTETATRGYEDDVSAVVAKLLLRKQKKSALHAGLDRSRKR